MKKIACLLLISIMVFAAIGCQSISDAAVSAQHLFGEGREETDAFDKQKAEKEAIEAKEAEIEAMAQEKAESEYGLTLEEEKLDAKWRNPDDEIERIESETRSTYFSSTKKTLTATYAKEVDETAFYKNSDLFKAVPEIYKIPICLNAKIIAYDIIPNNQLVPSLMSEEAAADIADVCSELIQEQYGQETGDRTVLAYVMTDSSMVYQSVDGLRVRAMVFAKIVKSNDAADERYLGVWLSNIAEYLITDPTRHGINAIIELGDWQTFTANEGFIRTLETKSKT